MSRTRDPERSIRTVDFELPRGEVSIEKLMAMEPAEWEHLRREINIRHQQNKARPLACCGVCRGPIYIRGSQHRGRDVPMFAHYPDSLMDCPWHHGPSMTPDKARAAQYQGRQESSRHARLCELLEEVAKADPRCTDTAIDTYRRSQIHKRGRWPDVFLDMGPLGRFVLEVQLSKPFAPEIAARHLHYEREGEHLIWVFSELENPMPLGFRDVVTMQRGNAFVFDHTAQVASYEHRTVVLNCYIEDGHGGWLPPRLVKLDDLKTGKGRAVFLEDRRSELLEQRCRANRKVWVKACRTAQQRTPDDPAYDDVFITQWSGLKDRVPGLGKWEAENWPFGSDRARFMIANLVLMLCSIAHSAAGASPVLYVTKFKGANAVLQMLNTKMTAGELRPCADLVRTFVSRTVLAGLLVTPSLQRILEQGRMAAPQIGPGHPVWEAMAVLFAEVLDGLVRAELSDLDRLPAWASQGAGTFEPAGRACPVS
ncbi:hypothetical protein GR702_21130 [Novosphingobium sp. FGD1]|uniref:Competence protein n=1 Tax=Novosphingobium silvae TaxID=2692619 RepID=A0A7X4GL44_9SPHN|nr:hypothetical protein [Novosphingobium silvae]MYM00251.1 hypothetical protein [Novosphingobium silvae]